MTLTIREVFERQVPTILERLGEQFRIQFRENQEYEGVTNVLLRWDGDSLSVWSYPFYRIDAPRTRKEAIRRTWKAIASLCEAMHEMRVNAVPDLLPEAFTTSR